MIQIPPSGDSSGWPDGYEDLESGDNGFPGDMDEGDCYFSTSYVAHVYG